MRGTIGNIVKYFIFRGEAIACKKDAGAEIESHVCLNV